MTDPDPYTLPPISRAWFAALADPWTQRTLLVVLRHPGCDRALVRHLLGPDTRALRAIRTLLDLGAVQTIPGDPADEDRASYVATPEAVVFVVNALSLVSLDHAVAVTSPTIDWYGVS
jgi:hypothetical protein